MNNRIMERRLEKIRFRQQKFRDRQRNLQYVYSREIDAINNIIRHRNAETEENEEHLDAQEVENQNYEYLEEVDASMDPIETSQNQLVATEVDMKEESQVEESENEDQEENFYRMLSFPCFQRTDRVKSVDIVSRARYLSNPNNGPVQMIFPKQVYSKEISNKVHRRVRELSMPNSPWRPSPHEDVGQYGMKPRLLPSGLLQSPKS